MIGETLFYWWLLPSCLIAIFTIFARSWTWNKNSFAIWLTCVVVWPIAVLIFVFYMITWFVTGGSLFYDYTDEG